MPHNLSGGARLQFQGGPQGKKWIVHAVVMLYNACVERVLFYNPRVGHGPPGHPPTSAPA
jgi:hypothetical protein